MTRGREIVVCVWMDGWVGGCGGRGGLCGGVEYM